MSATTSIYTYIKGEFWPYFEIFVSYGMNFNIYKICIIIGNERLESYNNIIIRLAVSFMKKTLKYDYDYYLLIKSLNCRYFFINDNYDYYVQISKYNYYHFKSYI